MATKCNFEASPGRDRFVRFTRLLIAGGTPILREVFKLYHNPTTLATALGSTRIGFTKPQKRLVFPDPPGSLPNFEDFDISLIFKLLRNCCRLTEPVTRWNELPVEGDVSLEADIVRIDFYRNEVYGHTLETMALTQEDFDKYWDIISDALCRIVTNHLHGESVAILHKIQELKFSPLTHDDRRLVEEHLRNIKSSLAEQDKKLDNIEAKEDQIKQGIEGLQDTMINAFQCTKISDNKTIPSAAAPSQVNQYNFTLNQYIPSYTQGPPPPGLTQGSTRRFSEGTNYKQQTPPRPYHKSYSQPAIGQQRVSSQERYGNPAEDRSQFQFPPRADEYQQVSNPVWQRPNQRADTALFYVDQDDSPDGRTWNTNPSYHADLSRDDRQTTPDTRTRTANLSYHADIRDDWQTPPDARTRTANPSYHADSRDDWQTPLDARTRTANPSYHADSREDRQTPPDARLRTTSFNQGFSSGPYNINSREDRQTPPDARLQTTSFNQGFSSGPYNINSREDRQTPPDARLQTTSFNQGFSSGPYNINSREDRQTPPDARLRTTSFNQGFSSGPYNINSREDRQTPPDARLQTTSFNQGFSSGPYNINSREDRQTPPDARLRTTSFNKGFSSGPYTSRRDNIYRQLSTASPLVSSENEWSSSRQQQDVAPLLRITISVRGAAGLSDFDLANVVRSGMDGSNEGAAQFTSYLDERRKLTIMKIEGNLKGESCSIEVSPRVLKSLEDLWHDFIVQDLKEIVKETVLPENYRGDVDVSIDSEEYKRCCERLRPRVFKDSGRQLHSQSFSQVGMACDEVFKSSKTISRSQSVMDLPSTQKNASQELLQLICNYGGKMDWQKAKQQLSGASYTELTKPAFQQNMNRYLEFLPNNVVQIRLRFCPKMRKDSTCSNTNCPDLHLCIYNFLTDRHCNFPSNCKNSHDISDEHTNNVFKMANLSFLDNEERKQLLRNVAFVAPEFCIYYNKTFDSCTKGVNCPYLHVCKDWVLVGRVCAAKTGCQRVHTFENQHEQDILKKKNLHQMSEKEIIQKLNEYYN